MVKADRFFGNLSYPMYLCHWGVGIVVFGLFHIKTRSSLRIFAIGFPLVNIISYLIYAYVEHPLQSWKLSSSSRPRSATFLAGNGFTQYDAASVSSPISGSQSHIQSGAPTNSGKSDSVRPIGSEFTITAYHLIR